MRRRGDVQWGQGERETIVIEARSLENWQNPPDVRAGSQERL